MFRKRLLIQINRWVSQGSTKIIKAPLSTAASEPNETSYTLESADIEKAIKQTPLLASIPNELWQKSHEIFVNQGIKTNDFLKIIESNPTIISRPSKHVINSIETWRSCQFGENRLHELLTAYPQLLDVQNDTELRSKMRFLQEYFATAKNVWRLFMNSPNILKDSNQVIQEKIDYLVDVMKLETPEICKSKVFEKSLEEIRLRHVFLERLGIFKVSKKKSAADENNSKPSKNPRLHLIVDTDNREFVTKVCGLSLAEYEAFVELYPKEMGRGKDNYYSDDEEEK